MSGKHSVFNEELHAQLISYSIFESYIDKVIYMKVSFWKFSYPTENFIRAFQRPIKVFSISSNHLTKTVGRAQSFSLTWKHDF